MTRGAIVLVVGLTACGREGPVSDCLDALPTATTVDPNAVQELLIAGDVGSAAGIFDPSLVYPSEAPAGFMSYSSVGAADAIRTRIAVSTDRGDHWTYLADANAPAAITVEASDP